MVCVFVCVEREREIYFKELAPVIMGADKSEICKASQLARN